MYQLADVQQTVTRVDIKNYSVVRVAAVVVVVAVGVVIVEAGTVGAVIVVPVAVSQVDLRVVIVVGVMVIVADEVDAVLKRLSKSL